MTILSFKEISGACAGDKSDGVSQGEQCHAPLGSPSARVSRAGEIQNGKNLGRLRPRFLREKRWFLDPFLMIS